MDQQEQKNTGAKGARSSKGKIIAVIVIVLAALGAIGAWFTGLAGGISQAEAREIALAQAPGATDADVVFAQGEFDDLSKEYEVQINYDGVLYEYQILARNGNIISLDTEGAPYQEQPRTEAQEQAQPQTEAQAQPQTQSETQAADIGVERAKEIALAQVSGAAAADITRAEMDRDDGRLQYEIEITYDNREYDFDIDAATGDIISQSNESVFD